MIHYNLICEQDHQFESWFQNSDAFERLAIARQVTCPHCGSLKVGRALMAPAITRETTERFVPSEAEIAQLRAHVESNSEYVGMEFVSEARRIHAGEAPERAIYGEARPAEALALIEDGVPVAPLPFLPRSKLN